MGRLIEPCPPGHFHVVCPTSLWALAIRETAMMTGTPGNRTFGVRLLNRKIAIFKLFSNPQLVDWTMDVKTAIKKFTELC